MPDPRPNVVLICADQWRGDCLSAAGHPVVRTPYLDALTDTGTRFGAAYSATPTCVPARMSLMTGLRPPTHRRVGYADGVPFDVGTTLAGEFRAAGYQTKAVGKLHVWPERARIGFDDVTLHDGYLSHSRDRHRPAEFYDDYLPWLRRRSGDPAADIIDDGLDCNSIVARPWDRPEELHPTNWVVTEAIRWLYRRDPTAPFLCHLSFHRPHPPLDPPVWAFEQYRHAPDHTPPVGDWVDRLLGPLRQDQRPDAFVARYDQATLNRARAGYYGNISHVDQQVQRFLTALREFGLAGNTVVCFVSDHGEMLGEHNLWRKAFGYEGSARIPMVLSGPGIGSGRRVDEITELRDVMPTLLAAAGVPVPDTVEGRNMVPLTHGDAVGWREHLHGEHVLFDNLAMHWIRTRDGAGEYKYIWLSATGDEQLFDLDRDPCECHDLAASAEHRDVLRRCRELLVGELTGRPEGFVAAGDLVPGRPTPVVLPRGGDRGAQPPSPGQ